MIVNNNSQLKDVREISEQQKRSIKDFLQGAVYCWCKNRKNEWFSLRDLMGGDNYFWDGTPLISLYDKYKNKSSDPVGEAGKDAGWLLKSVISNDNRRFETKKEQRIRQYKWTEEDKNT